MTLEIFSNNISTTLLLVGIGALWILSILRRRKLPPGPPGFPLIGNILQINMNDAVNEFHRLRQQYGDVFCVKLFNLPNIVINGKDALTELLVKHADALTDRPDNLFVYVFTHKLGKDVWIILYFFNFQIF